VENVVREAGILCVAFERRKAVLRIFSSGFSLSFFDVLVIVVFAYSHTMKRSLRLIRWIALKSLSSPSFRIT